MDTRLIKAGITNAIISLAQAKKALTEGTGKEVMTGLEDTLAAIETARSACVVASVRANEIRTKQLDKKPTLRLVSTNKVRVLGEANRLRGFGEMRTHATRPAIPSVMPKPEQEDVQP